jgi:hypothetical protein
MNNGMDILVEFLEGSGARIIKDPYLIAQKIDLPNVLLNPEIKHLNGISPSFWIKNGQKIEAIDPEAAKKIVFESESDSGSLTPQKLVLFDTKLKEIKAQIDAQRDQDIHNILRAQKHERHEISVEMQDIEDRLISEIMRLEDWVKKEQRKVFMLSFFYLIAMILIKFL